MGLFLKINILIPAVFQVDDPQAPQAVPALIQHNVFTENFHPHQMHIVPVRNNLFPVGHVCCSVRSFHEPAV